jgi:hypothetical protein
MGTGCAQFIKKFNLQKQNKKSLADCIAVASSVAI